MSSSPWEPSLQIYTPLFVDLHCICTVCFTVANRNSELNMHRDILEMIHKQPLSSATLSQTDAVPSHPPAPWNIMSILNWSINNFAYTVGLIIKNTTMVASSRSGSDITAIKAPSSARILHLQEHRQSEIIQL